MRHSLTISACGGSSKPSAAPQCLRNSDCTGGLVCSLGYCVEACEASIDCPNNERRVISDTTAADGGGSTACLAPESASCAYTSQCRTPLVCSLLVTEPHTGDVPLVGDGRALPDAANHPYTLTVTSP